MKKDGKKRRRRALIWWVLAILGGLLVCGVAVLCWCFFGPKEVVFSEGSGFYDHEISVRLGVEWGFLWPDQIKFNMNGDDLANTGDIYVDEIKLEVPETGYKLYTITAAICGADGKCETPRVATYVLGKKLDEDVTVDIININSSQANLYDYYTGIMVGGFTYDLNNAGKIDDEGEDMKGNYNNRGKKWMKESHITMFDTNKNLHMDQNAYIGISGGSSASFDVKSMKVEYCDASETEGDCWKEFKLRSGGQDQFFGNIRSSVVSRLVEESGFDGGTSTQRAVVFLNGDYYGIFDIQQNYSNRNLAKKFGLKKKKKIEKYKVSEATIFDVLNIADELWDELDVEENRDRLEEVFDMDNYLEYYAIQILFNNTDWPTNNYEIWKYNGTERTDNKYEDGRMRFLIYDTDLIYYGEENINFFEGSIGDIFEFLMEDKYNGKGSSFRKVMESEYYRGKFVDLIRKLINGPFATENVLRIIDEEAEKIEHQVKLFYSEEEYEEWRGWIELMKKAAGERNEEMRVNIRKYFNVEL